nr:Clostripain family protein [Lachnospiraceae bacterium]
MKKKVIGVILGVVVLLGLGSCLLGEDEDTEYAQVEDDDEEDEEEKEEKQSGEGDSNVTATPLSADLTRGMELSVNGKSGELSITRFDSFHGEAVEDGIWTIFVYLCGTDLESFYGMATGDMEEMLSIDGADNVRYIVQTGGTQAWYNDEVDSNATQRFLLQDGYMELVDEQSIAGMGDSATLTDFLTWGTENYPSEHTGLIFWDHGGGSITGVCFDEMSDYDSLSLLEIDQALYSASQNMGQKFDFIGFDACLMGTVETATILATYADYMYGSEETEPGSGWDYNAITEFLYDHPEAGGKELGE